ncbi:Histone H2A [Mycena venus]|uniref:Histone H2A n=1 Tax=Mycena venus TaxID=2733690 RepID=A0A8H6YE98_9AGAR|nr:Histone H2A [Mycena venus]
MVSAGAHTFKNFELTHLRQAKAKEMGGNFTTGVKARPPTTRAKSGSRLLQKQVSNFLWPASGVSSKKHTKNGLPAHVQVDYPPSIFSKVADARPVYFAAVLEYMMAELLELAGNCAREVGRKRITPRHILLAIKNDDEMDKLLKRVIVVDGGVLPFIHWQLIPQKNAKKGGQSQEV